MIQNGILLSFTRLATRLCFLDVRLSVLCLSSFPSSRKLHPCPFQNLPKPKPKDRENSSSLSASSPSCSTRHGPIIYGSQSASSSVHYVHYALKQLPFSARLQPCRGFLFPPHLAFCFHSLHLHFFYVCVWRVFWNSLDKGELSKTWTFLSTE